MFVEWAGLTWSELHCQELQNVSTTVHTTVIYAKCVFVIYDSLLSCGPFTSFGIVVRSSLPFNLVSLGHYTEFFLRVT